MKRALLAVLLSLLAVDAARAAPVPADPSGVPPDLSVVRKDGANLIVDVTVYAEVPVVRETLEIIEGKPVKAITMTMVTVPRQFKRSVPLKDVRAWTADGKPLNADALGRRLERATVVCITRDGQLLNPSFRAVLRDDVLILALPAVRDQDPPPLPPMPMPDLKPRPEVILPPADK